MAAKKSCLKCGNGFIGRANASYCSPGCRLRAHRGKGAGETVTGETVSPAQRRRPRRGTTSTDTSETAVDRPHSAEALALKASLVAELAESSQDRGEDLEWSAAEQAALDMAMCAIDRKVDLYARYLASDDDKVRVKLSGEIRLLEASVDRLLKRVPTDVPDPPTRVSQKASHAAKVRWQGAAR
jgi:hypothetical protein